MAERLTPAARQTIRKWLGLERPLNPDIVVSLLDDIDDCEVKLTQLRRENERLREALRPFTEIGGWYGKPEIPLANDQERAFVIPIGWLNKARAALHQEPPKGE